MDMINPSFLGQLTQQQAAFDPAAMIGKNLSLMDIMGKVQAQQLQLAQLQGMQKAYGDENFMSGLSSYIQNAMGQQQDPNAPPAPSTADMLRNVPAAARPAILKQLQDYTETGAKIYSSRMAGLEKEQAAKKIGVDMLANGAYKLANQDGPITPMQMAAFLQQAKWVNTPNEMFATMPALGASDPSMLKDWMSTFAAFGMDPEHQTNIWKTRTLLPGEVAQQKATLESTQAGTEKTRKETSLMDFQAQTARISANASAQEAATRRAEYMTGKPVGDASTGQQAIAAPSSFGGPLTGSWLTQGIPGAPAAPGGPTGGAGGPALPSAPGGAPGPAAGPPGPPAAAPAAAPPPPPAGPMQVALNPMQKVAAEGLKPRLDAINADADAARKVNALVPALRGLVMDAGALNGPLNSSAAGRNMLSALAAMGFNVDKVSALRASDVLTSEMFGSMMKQLGTRGSNMMLSVVQSVKPGSENPTPVRLRMLDGIVAHNNSLIDYANTVNKYVMDPANRMDFGLTGVPEPKPLVLPKAASGARVTKPPPAATMPNATLEDEKSGNRISSRQQKDGTWKWVPE